VSAVLLPEFILAQVDDVSLCLSYKTNGFIAGEVFGVMSVFRCVFRFESYGGAIVFVKKFVQVFLNRGQIQNVVDGQVASVIAHVTKLSTWFTSLVLSNINYEVVERHACFQVFEKLLRVVVVFELLYVVIP